MINIFSKLLSGGFSGQEVAAGLTAAVELVPSSHNSLKSAAIYCIYIWLAAAG